MLRSTLLLTVVCWGGWAWSEEVQPRGIPYRPDPPPAIDGRLDDWRQTPVWQTIERREQVIYGAARWTSLTDLSAKIHLAWREECLYWRPRRPTTFTGSRAAARPCFAAIM